MNPRKRVLLLILIMSLLVFSTLFASIGILYKTAIDEESIRLAETAKSQARLIEAVARFDKQYSKGYPLGPKQATLEQIRAAHSQYQGFGITGEFTLAEKRGDQIVFLLSHRHYDLDNPKPVHWDSGFAEPMRLALSDKSGIVIGYDYRGEKVIAAHEPVAELDLGIVAKIDLSEVQAPFLKATLITAAIAVVLIVLGVSVFFKITNPILVQLSNTVESLQNALEEVTALRGILPICSFCKKIRDDDGYWNQVEVYITKHSDADFSHGICPDCMIEHYPEFCKENDNSDLCDDTKTEPSGGK